MSSALSPGCKTPQINERQGGLGLRSYRATVAKQGSQQGRPLSPWNHEAIAQKNPALSCLLQDAMSVTLSNHLEELPAASFFYNIPQFSRLPALWYHVIEGLISLIISCTNTWFYSVFSLHAVDLNSQRAYCVYQTARGISLWKAQALFWVGAGTFCGHWTPLCCLPCSVHPQGTDRSWQDFIATSFDQIHSVSTKHFGLHERDTGWLTSLLLSQQTTFISHDSTWEVLSLQVAELGKDELSVDETHGLFSKKMSQTYYKCHSLSQNIYPG